MIEQLALLFGRSHRVVRRAIIVVCYLLVLATALYLPLLFDHFRSQKTLNVYAFTETFSPQALERFEKKTGIKVNMTYAELDEEIGAKFSINAGAGYDVVNVSDFMVHFLANKGYLQPLNKSKIKGIDRLDARLMAHTYDKANHYSLPHKWFMYGLIYDKEFFNVSPDEMSLKMIFEDPVLLCKQGIVRNPYRICMLASPLDAYFMTMLYAFNRVDWFTPSELDEVASLLIKQKQWVECYSFNSVEYFLLSGIVPIALTASNFIRKIWESSDRFDFAIPKEGGIIIIENLVIPAVSKKSELAHQFIEFMLSDEIATLNSEAYGWTSSNCIAQKILDEEHSDKKSHLFPSKEIFQRLQIPLFNSYARQCADNAWLRVSCA